LGFERNKTFKLQASANSGPAVKFESGNTNRVTITGNKATILRKGEVTITASQGGNGNYLAAKSVPRKVRIK
jgi:urease beta subunit